jgi:hypothetical protein
VAGAGERRRERLGGSALSHGESIFGVEGGSLSSAARGEVR